MAIPQHPTPEAALKDLEGLTSDELVAIIKQAVYHGKQVAPQRGIDRFYCAEIAGFKYSFHYSVKYQRGATYRLSNHAMTWAIEFTSSGRLDGRFEEYIVIPVITVTPRACFDFVLEGDREQFRHDMSKLKLFL